MGNKYHFPRKLQPSPRQQKFSIVNPALARHQLFQVNWFTVVPGARSDRLARYQSLLVGDPVEPGFCCYLCDRIAHDHFPECVKPIAN